MKCKELFTESQYVNYRDPTMESHNSPFDTFVSVNMDFMNLQ